MYITPPTLTQLTGESRYAISFIYDFSADAVNNAIHGSEFQLNTNTFQGVLNLPIFNSLQISATFDTGAGLPYCDGPLVVTSPSSGQQIVISPNQTLFDPTAINNTEYVVTTIVPIITQLPVILNFFKGAYAQNGGPNIMKGKIYATLTTDKLPTYSISGFCNNLSF